MQHPWYQSKYAKAAAIAASTGIITGLMVWLGIFDDPTLSMRTTVKIVGIAVLSPFAALVRLLPSLDSVLTTAQLRATLASYGYTLGELPPGTVVHLPVDTPGATITEHPPAFVQTRRPPDALLPPASGPHP